MNYIRFYHHPAMSEIAFFETDDELAALLASLGYIYHIVIYQKNESQSWIPMIGESNGLAYVAALKEFNADKAGIDNVSPV